MPDLQSALAELASVAADCVALAPAAASAASDDALLELQRSVANSARLLETASASLAAEIAHRSRRELGYDGLAQKRGVRTPEALIQVVTGSSAPTARRLVRVGTLVAHNAGHFEQSTEPWLAEVLAAAGGGTLSAEAVDAIRSGLGSPSGSASPDALADAAGQLLARATSVSIETLAALARQLRNDLDAAGVALREQELRDKRFARLTRQPDGTTRLVAVLDPESAASIVPILDAATSPRRGGPRFVDPDETAREERILNDERTTEQITLDALVELLQLGARGDSSHLIGAQPPAVRVLVTKRDLDAGVGAGYLEGQSEAISIASVERRVCAAGIVPVQFDDEGQALNLGRAERRHRARQRTAIATRDGGCMAPGCDRPPSWSEVHHIVPWSEGGETSVADGVLLCRHHHLLLHNNGWRITRTGSAYWLHPTPDLSSEPIRLRTKSPALRRLLAG